MGLGSRQTRKDDRRNVRKEGEKIEESFGCSDRQKKTLMETRQAKGAPDCSKKGSE